MQTLKPDTRKRILSVSKKLVSQDGRNAWTLVIIAARL